MRAFRSPTDYPQWIILYCWEFFNWQTHAELKRELLFVFSHIFIIALLKLIGYNDDDDDDAYYYYYFYYCQFKQKKLFSGRWLEP